MIKTAIDICCCGKGIILTGSISKLLGFAVAKVSREMSQGFLYIPVVQAGEAALSYIFGIGFISYICKVAKLEKIKVMARLVYNLACLPFTLYSKEVTATADVLHIYTLKEIWFGAAVHIFNDNRLWIESNFTMDNIFERITDPD